MGRLMPIVADLVIRELRRSGVRTLFGVPGGGGNLDLIAAAGRAGLPFVLTATETAGAIAAMAQAEITGDPGACLTTIGPGAASAVNGLACAFLDRAPLVAFTDSYSAATRAQYEHQRIDHAQLLRPVTKSSVTLTADRAAGIVAEALRVSRSNRPGPVHIDCPGDVLSAEAAAPDGAPAARDFGEASTVVFALARFEATLAQARKPLLVVGLGARRPADAAAIRALCERKRVPAMVTYKGKGIVPDDHPWFAGVFTLGAIEQPLVEESDLLIGIGFDPIELLPRPWTRKPAIVYCGPSPVETGHVPFMDQHVTEVADAVAHLEGAMAESHWDADGLRAHADSLRARVMLDAPGLTAQRVVRAAAARLGPLAGRVTVDAGAHMLPATTLWPVREPNAMLISNGLSTMGFALPAAIGAALVDRSRPVVALTGDGGLLMCTGELLTAARERLRIIVIVFADASLSLIEIKQQARGLPAAGVALGDAAWAAIARGMGFEAFVADTEPELDRALERAASCAGPSLIEARIDRSNYGATLRAVRGS
jgi:acetolactate synthase-1/2/3 large subunit